MRAEYKLTAQQRAEIAEIERQIFVLQIRKAEIYAVAPVEYITENLEDAKAVERTMKVNGYLRSGPLIPKERIVALMESEVSGNEYDGE